jgi:hypothetical protein
MYVYGSAALNDVASCSFPLMHLCIALIHCYMSLVMLRIDCFIMCVGVSSNDCVLICTSDRIPTTTDDML